MTRQVNMPCANGCGSRVRIRTSTFDTPIQCYRCRLDPEYAAAARAARDARDAARIDWLAIELVVTEGQRVPLNIAEARIAVRRLRHRMIGVADNPIDLAPGQLTAEQVADRIGTTREALFKLIKRLPAATQRRCPVCRGDMWIIDATGVVEEHVGADYTRCPMSDRLGEQRVRLQPVPQAMLVLRCHQLLLVAAS